MKKTNEEKVRDLVALRQTLASMGDANGVQSVNYELARLAKIMKVDYYSL